MSVVVTMPSGFAMQSDRLGIALSLYCENQIINLKSPSGVGAASVSDIGGNLLSAIVSCPLNPTFPGFLFYGQLFDCL